MKPVLIIGSINIDLVMQASSIPRPGETISGKSFNTYFGGKGSNQAVAAARMGANVHICGAVGQDEYGRMAIANMRDNGVNCDGINMVGLPTGTAMISVDANGENAIITYQGANSLNSADNVMVMSRRLQPAGIILIQQELSENTLLSVLKFGKALGWQIILNAAPARQWGENYWQSVDILIVNQCEAEALSEQKLTNTDSVKSILTRLLLPNMKMVVLTLGKDGIYFYDCYGIFKHVESPKANAIDTTGAGDAFCGALAAFLAENQDNYTALQWAAIAASQSVTRNGAQSSITRKELNDSLNNK